MISTLLQHLCTDDFWICQARPADAGIGVATAFRLVWMRPSRMTWRFFLYAAGFNPGQSYVYYALL
ncbi:MAG: hypothetical protein M3Y41_06600 [Pseudomonadota bacterium]|nr:hypothetical protein [Pseudomonadota bacterium]